MGYVDLYTPELPEPLIHRIQSLLTREKAAETTLLSKSWAAAWWTRPTIDLDESIFPPDPSSYGEIDGVVKSAKKTFRRYEESNLRINTFRLCLDSLWYGLSGLATKWTLKALALGATDLTFRLRPGTAIPLQDIFGSENIARLCLEYSIIFRPKVITCRGLKSLTLSHVNVSTRSFVKIISSCPLIENLSLSHVDRISSYDGCNDDDDDDDDDDDGDGDDDDDDHDCYDDEEEEEQEEEEEEEEEDDEYELNGLEKLKSLEMCFVKCNIQNLILSALSSKFPNLKELTLKLSKDRSYNPGREAREIQIISSHSLEILNFGEGDEGRYYYSHTEDIVPRVEFDFPSIREFTFEGSYIPNLYFRSTMDQWDESHVSLDLSRSNGLNTKWFLELSNFLTKFRLSKIHLCLHLHGRSREKCEYQEGEIESSNAHQVEDLTINSECLPSLSFNALLDGLFRICRPKMINQCASRKNDELLCRALEEVMKVKNMLLPTHFKHGLTDLDEVIAQKLVDGVWKPEPIDSLLDDSERFRFLLKWKPSLNQGMRPRSEEDEDNENDDDDGDEDDDDDGVVGEDQAALPSPIQLSKMLARLKDVCRREGPG